MEGEFTYETNMYYGIFCRFADAEKVQKALRDHPEYSKIANDEGEIALRREGGENYICGSFNSDSDTPSHYFIFVDEMTIMSEEFPGSSGSYIKFEPTECTKAEQSNREAVGKILDIYDYLVAKLVKTKQINAKNIFSGWCVISCEWDEGSDESEEELSPEARSPLCGKPVKPVKKEYVPKKKAEPKPRKAATVAVDPTATAPQPVVPLTITTPENTVLATEEKPKKAPAKRNSRDRKK